MYTELASTIGKIIENAFQVNTEVTLSVPSSHEHGDATTNIALQIGKEIGRNPLEVARIVAEKMESTDGIAKVEVAGPGFVNLMFTADMRLEQTLLVREACTPQPTRTAEHPVIVEYAHPNIAKPLGVHHILSTVIGQTIANLYRHGGYPVIAWNYIGDWGTQFGKLAVALEKWGEDGKTVRDYSLQDLLDFYVRFHDEAENDPSLEDQGRAAFRRLEKGDPDIRAFWKDVVALSLRDLDILFRRLHVSFDVTKGESYYEEKMESILEEGKTKGIFVEGKEGALIVEFPEEEHLPPFMILKSDGGTLYSTRDLALALDRKNSLEPSAVLHVVDVAQKLHFQQLFATMRKLHWDMAHEEHVVYGRMSFSDKSMSTRKGNIIRLEEVLDEAVKRADALIAEHGSEVEGEERSQLAEMVGVGAFVYGVLSQNRKNNMVFTWEKALTFEGNSGPYLQYTHARARSVLRKSGMTAWSVPAASGSMEPSEIALMRTIIRFPDALEEARRDVMPHKLANYLYELCQSYNSFYNALPILIADEPARAVRLALTGLSADILKTGAEILTLRVPDRM